MRMRKQKHSAMNKSLNQEDQFSDTQRQMIMGSLKKAIPTIHCPSSVQACQLCINPHCHNVSLKCSSSKCIACYEPQQHQSCIKITLHKFTELVNKKTYPWRQELISIFKLEEKLMTIIRATFMEFTQKFMASKMKEYKIESIIDIFENRNYYALRGSQSSDLCNHLQKKQTQDEKNKSVNKLKQYEKMLESQMENIKNIRSKFFISEVTLQIPLNTKQTKKPEENIVKEQKLNSLIPTNKEKYNFESLSLLSNHKGFQKLKQYKEYDFGKVKFIDLFGCQIKNKGCQELRNTPFTQLQQLHLAENSIDDAGCKLLSQGNWNNLNTLNLRSNSIGYQGCRALCQAKWNNLKYLDLRQNKIEKTHQKQLQKQLKRRWAEIQILWQWPL